jgi:hypothetical protein
VNVRALLVLTLVFFALVPACSVIDSFGRFRVDASATRDALPDSTADVPDGTADVPDGTADVPDSTADVTVDTVLADGTTDVPDGATDVPDSATDVSDMTDLGRPECTGATTLCNGVCVVTASDTRNCGECSVQCAPPHAIPACTNGRCVLASCEAGFADCNADPRDGCEVNVATNFEHCGRCDALCRAPEATTVCADNLCRITECRTGRGDCNMNIADGCETDITTSLAHCGSCGAACVLPSAVPGCFGGRCVVQSCPSQRADCDGMSVNGCETDITTSAAHCGGCGRPCPSNAVCMNGVCAITSCPTGMADCDGVVSNGCEVNVSASVEHCGRCNNRCSVANGTPVCRSGACAIAACTTARGDCDLRYDTGCETDTNSSPAHCGRCGAPCPSNAVCSVGRCVITSCPSGFADCDRNAANGCEVDLRSDPANCGACGNACLSSTCRGGTCWNLSATYGTQDLPTCGGACTPNPYTGGCSCPAGYFATSIRRVIDCPSGVTYTGAGTGLCGTPTPGTFGGAFQFDLTCGRNCFLPNPYTRACSCPEGTGQIFVADIVTDPTCGRTAYARTYVCGRGFGAATLGGGFGGVFLNADPFGATPQCRNVNAFTGACTCPVGYGQQAYRVLIPQAGASLGYIGAYIFVCVQ